MTTCIKCGKPIPDGELFCAQCSLNPGVAELDLDEPQRPAPPAGRMQKPVPVQKPQPRPAPQAPKKQAGAGLIRGFVAVCVLCAVLLGLCVWQYATRAKANVALRVREDAITQREQALEQLEADLTARTDELAAAQAQLDEQQTQIDRLQAMVNAAESSMNQTQYDMTTQQAQMDLLEQKNETLQDEAKQLGEQIQTLTEQNQTLIDAAELFQKKAAFMDAYVVFVENDGTGWYHMYDCPHFAQKSFWAYSRKLAEKNRYTPCPYCFE